MSREKQIEEMVKTVSACECDCINCKICYSWELCEALYNAGYRKQSEGEWIEHRETRPYEEVCYICSRCGRKEYQKEPYCHCGAKMKGGAE
jgi:hypothetical protein